MGKLTDSIKAAGKQLEEVRTGIDNMHDLSLELSQNTLNVAESALKTGYAYAKSELDGNQPSRLLQESSLPNSPSVIAKDLLPEQHDNWTKETLRNQFGSCNSAYNYLKDKHNIKLKTVSWDNVINAFNSSDQESVANSLSQPEQILQLNQRVSRLEARLDTVVQQLNQIMIVIQES